MKIHKIKTLMTNRQIEQNFCLIIQLNWACLQDYTQGATYRIIGNIKARASLQSQPQESDNSQKLCPVIPCTTFSQLHQKCLLSPVTYNRCILGKGPCESPIFWASWVWYILWTSRGLWVSILRFFRRNISIRKNVTKHWENLYSFMTL